MKTIYHKFIGLVLYFFLSLTWASNLFAAEVNYTSPLVFNSQDYLELNPDITIYGLSPEEHWTRIGMKECRQASKQFSPKEYLKNNKRVANFFGENNCHGAVWDYITYGHKVGRNINYFDNRILMTNSSDLTSFISWSWIETNEI